MLRQLSAIQLLTIFAKCSIVDVGLGSEYASRNPT